MKSCGFTDREIEGVFELIAAILKLGNVKFYSEDSDSPAVIKDFRGNLFVALLALIRLTIQN